MNIPPRPSAPAVRSVLFVFVCVLFFAFPSRSPAQPGILWDKTIGGTHYEELNALRVVADGILAGGSTRSNATFGNPADTSWNLLLVKLDFKGATLWSRSYGGDRDDRLWALLPTSDGGFLAGGYSWSDSSGDKSEDSRGSADIWLLRLDANGNVIWDKTYGGNGFDELFSILETPEGRFLLGCNSKSGKSGEKSEISRGEQDFWLICIAPDGNMLWDKTLGGNGVEQIHDLAWAPDGALLLSGGTTSKPDSADMGPAFARGAKDFCLLKFDPQSKKVLWTRRYGGTSDEFAYALHVSPSGKIYQGGRSASQPAPPTTYNNGKNAAFYGGDSDYWLLELDAQGQKMREWSFGGAGLDDLYFISENILGQLVLGGVSDSDVSGNKAVARRGGYDYWLLSLDAGGQILWQKTIGGSANDAPTQLAELPDGAWLVGGHSGSDAGFEKSDDSFGANDFWIVHTACNVNVQLDFKTPPLPCATQMLSLEASAQGCNNCLFFWNTGASGATLPLPAGARDTFFVRAVDEWGCRDTAYLYVDTPLPPAIELGPADTLLAADGVLSIGDGGKPGWKYRWSTGATTPRITVTGAGLYAVTITDANGCTASDFIRVLADEKGQVWAPNVFSPNFDGFNDIFNIYHDDQVQRIVSLQIYDRWGALCFRRDGFLTLNENEGWNGEYRGKAAAEGVYTWFARVEFSGGRQELFKGDVTIVR